MKNISDNQRWAILLCGVPGQNVPVTRRDRNHFINLFVNNGANSLNRYWRNASHDTINLDGSQVFGWVNLPDSFNTVMARSQRIFDAAAFFSNLDTGDQPVFDYDNFDGVLVVTDTAVDLTGFRTTISFGQNGETRPYGFAICWQNHAHSQIAHEMGHAFGLDHSFDTSPVSHSPNNDGRPGAYGDPGDIMSAMVNIQTFNRPPFGVTGPLLNAVNMEMMEWLDPARKFSLTGSHNSAHVNLRPLNRPDLAGTLAAKVGSVTIEFRTNEPSTSHFTNWDEGLNQSAVFVHTTGLSTGGETSQDMHSVLLSNKANVQALQTGDVLELGNRNWPYRSYTRIEVINIDPTNLTATVNLVWYEAKPEPARVGILQWIIDGVIGLGPDGNIIIVPPRQPVHDILIGLAMYEMAHHIEDEEMQTIALKNSMHFISKVAKKVGGES